MNYNNSRLKEAFLQAAAIDHSDSPYSLTLTLKRQIHIRLKTLLKTRV